MDFGLAFRDAVAFAIGYNISMPQPEQSPPATTPRRFSWRRLFQFRLRTILIVTTIIAVAFGWWSEVVLPWVDVHARLEGEDVVFDITHVGIEGIRKIRVNDNVGQRLWALDLQYEKGHRITYGIVPSGGSMPGRQIFPAEGRPESIRGRRVTVWIEYFYMETAPCRREFRKEFDIP